MSQGPYLAPPAYPAGSEPSSDAAQRRVQAYLNRTGHFIRCFGLGAHSPEHDPYRVLVEPSQADRQPHPDVMAPSAHTPPPLTSLATSGLDHAADVAGTIHEHPPEAG